ncbi:TPA: hypothetical protein EYP44_05890, partial [Candidatus Bathyarchaeota archaeon]|nr:hypothetical protein [Candidatus Bathyarchaeota archaeon]
MRVKGFAEAFLLALLPLLCPLASLTLCGRAADLDDRALTNLSVRPVSVVWSYDATIVANLADHEGQPLAHKTLVFELYYDDAWHGIGRSVTDDEGHAYLRYRADLIPGTYGLRAIFRGDVYYEPSNSTATLTVEKIPTSLSVSPLITATYGDRVEIGIGLIDDRGRPVPGSPIQYQVDTWAEAKRVVTDDDGQVSIAMVAGLRPGRYGIRFSFEGDEYRLPT